jgi:hypothetical protein
VHTKHLCLWLWLCSSGIDVPGTRSSCCICVARLKALVERQAHAPSRISCAARPLHTARDARSNPLVEQTRYDRRQLAFISFWANFRLPQRAAHCER